MVGKHKNEKDILNKLGIKELNSMQLKAHDAISNHPSVVLLSPTGTGKTLAFLLPILQTLDPNLQGIQVLIVVPSRELALQIEQVTRDMGSGFKANAVYGGRAGSKDKDEIKHPPTILIGTPGRIADHLRNETFSTHQIHTLVLDEYDKSLEIGFTDDLKTIIEGLPNLKKKVLTSATQKVKVPQFIGIRDPKHLNFLRNETQQLQLKVVVSPQEDKLNTLLQLIYHVGEGNGIIFCNFKDSIYELSDFLGKKNVDHTCFYGGLEQIDRERALIKFRNGSHRLLIATDLAARGIDIPALDFIIHFELPPRPDEFVHRNGRTARMNTEGTAYVIKWAKEELPVFVKNPETLVLNPSKTKVLKNCETLYISGGRKDKISKGDIAGLFLKQGNLSKDELGVIELKQDCAYVSVPYAKAQSLIHELNNARLKKKKVRISLLK